MDLIITSSKINLFSPWYRWKTGELALNNNHSLTQSIWAIQFVYIYRMTARARCSLLELFESYCKGWKTLPNEITRYYCDTMAEIFTDAVCWSELKKIQTLPQNFMFYLYFFMYWWKLIVYLFFKLVGLYSIPFKNSKHCIQY